MVKGLMGPDRRGSVIRVAAAAAVLLAGSYGNASILSTSVTVKFSNSFRNEVWDVWDGL